MANIEGFRIRTVLVVGTSGAGKSEVIRRLGGKAFGTGLHPETSASFESRTKSTGIFDIGEISKSQYHLVDTMGMLDSSKQDKEGLEDTARVLDQLKTVVGVIYVVAGRMHPAEADICDFLFNAFFHDLPPTSLLVLRTKCSDWETFDVEAEKKYLRSLGRIPKRILDAQYIPVDFHPYAPEEKTEGMTSKIRKHMASWETPVDLSKRAKIVSEYTHSEEKVEKLKEELANLIKKHEPKKENVGEQEGRVNAQEPARSEGTCSSSQPQKNPDQGAVERSREEESQEGNQEGVLKKRTFQEFTKKEAVAGAALVALLALALSHIKDTQKL